MEFSSFWRFRLLTIFISISLVNVGKFDCGDGIKECQYREWSSWRSCNKSIKTTKRSRAICCPPAIKIYDACLTHCNITTNPLQASEERNCNAIFKTNNSKCSPWLPWESCNLTSSGVYKQTRQRKLCCKIIKDCFKTCNISSSTYGSMYKEERICIDGIAESTKCSIHWNDSWNLFWSPDSYTNCSRFDFGAVTQV
ncbi:unnamed protein product [Mytilus coruscus]|uniref:Folate receptor-like domain-containing protein n=1 Tax=Mytilus coruscus TaxID=42192 RepID=A0A6J8F134_MYTCO|nr:unnamed protein product [Mytilus coruscus]